MVPAGSQTIVRSDKYTRRRGAHQQTKQMHIDELQNRPHQSEVSGPRAGGILERIFNPASIIGYRNEYLRLSTTLSYSYLLTLPFLVLYEVGVMLVNLGSPSGVRISADILVKQLMNLVGLDGTFTFGLIILLLGAGILWYERRHGVIIRPRYLGLMFVESLAYALLLGTLVGTIVGGLFGMAVDAIPLQMPGQPGGSLLSGLVLSLGAGVYEELIFRLVLVSLLFALLFFLRSSEYVRYGIAAVIGALIFSAIHYTGPYGDTFTLASFTFRFLMGLALNGLMLLRGFGIAVAAHALYDVYVTLLS